jgi:hypothetical protein
MSLSLYQATVPSFLQVLIPVGGLVEKARAHCADKGVPEEALLDQRLAEDMWPFAKQVAAACAHSFGAIEALRSGETGPDLNPPPGNFAALAAKVAAAVAGLQAVTEEEIAALEGGEVVFRFGERAMPFTASDYVLSFALPNFYFHASMAYGVLRNQGLAVGKMDWLGQVRMKG